MLINLAGVVYKESLEMDINDRRMIADIIQESTEDTFVIVHGTDTIELSSEFLDEVFDDRKIILTGAMKPFEVKNMKENVPSLDILPIAKARGFSNPYATGGWIKLSTKLGYRNSSYNFSC